MYAPSETCPAGPTIPIVISPALKLACSNCILRDLCLPVALSEENLERLDTLVTRRPTIKRGSALFHADDAFAAVYVVRTGFFKTAIAAQDGAEQVAGFFMAGEILGLDGIENDRHTCDAVALEDSQVCVIPLDELEACSRELAPLQRRFHRMMSREIVRDHDVMLLLGSMSAEKRLAAFLLDLMRRLRERGFSSSELVLRMTRREIGSYLGLTLETVSRAFSRLQQEAMLEVSHRNVSILREEALKNLVEARG